MALSGVEIFKLLPKKSNCKECGYPTCLAFAMKLALKQASLDDCKYVSQEARDFLGAASEPPIRKITVGTGNKALSVGEETVMFRHEKKFIHPCGFALNINDNDSAADVSAKVQAVKDSWIDKVGQNVGVELICVSNKSGNANQFAETVGKVAEAAGDTPLILNSTDSSAIKAAVSKCAGKKPLISAATEENYAEMTAIAKENGASLVVKAEGVDKLSDLVDKVTALGFKDIVLDPSSATSKQIIEQNTIIRRAAVKKSYKTFGYPIFTNVISANPADKLEEINKAAVGISKYSSIIVLSDISKSKMISLITLRQNIYTDPQVPMQVAQNVYAIGSPGENSPVLITTNFSLTYFIVQGEVENSKVPCWLVIMDVEGLSVLTAWSAGKFIAPKIANFIKECGIEQKTKTREIILPGYVAILSGSLEDKLGGEWKVTVGPREANGLPTFLKNKTGAA